jgi:hypothetical protein
MSDKEKYAVQLAQKNAELEKIIAELVELKRIVRKYKMLKSKRHNCLREIEILDCVIRGTTPGKVWGEY